MKKLTIKLNKRDWQQKNREFRYNYKNWEILQEIQDLDPSEIFEKHLLNNFSSINQWFEKENFLTIDFNIIGKTVIMISQY